MTTRMRQFKLKEVRIRIKGWEETENRPLSYSNRNQGE